jgi:hypothetical protein
LEPKTRLNYQVNTEEETVSKPESKPVAATDFMGKVIKTNDTICYPVRRGSAMWLKKLEVKSSRDTPRGPCVSGVNEAGRNINIYNLSNCVVVN